MRSKTQMGPMRVPEIYCPFPSRISPYVEAVNTSTLAWATRLGLIQTPTTMRRFSRSRFAWLTASVYPSASLEELKLLNGWATWLLLVDDHFDDGPPEYRPEAIRGMLDHYRAILANPGTVHLQSPVAVALGELCQRTAVLVPEYWWGRFCLHFAQHFDTYPWTTANRARSSFPDFATYIEKRRNSGGMTMAIDLIELAEQSFLPASLLQSPAFETLTRITNDVVCWTNDIYSLEKERARGDVNNLVLVIQHAQNLTLQQAVDAARARSAQTAGLQRRSSRALPALVPELGPAIGAYVGDLKAWMRGNLDWSTQTSRYALAEPGEAASYPEASVLSYTGGQAGAYGRFHA